MSWDGKHIFISTALAHEDIDLRYDGDVTWDAVFGALSIGVLTEGVVVQIQSIKRQDEGSKRVSVMSSD